MEIFSHEITAMGLINAGVANFFYSRMRRPFTIVEVAASLGVSKSSVYNALTFLQTEGYISKEGRQKITVTMSTRFLKLKHKHGISAA